MQRVEACQRDEEVIIVQECDLILLPGYIRFTTPVKLRGLKFLRSLVRIKSHFILKRSRARRPLNLSLIFLKDCGRDSLNNRPCEQETAGS